MDPCLILVDIQNDDLMLKEQIIKARDVHAAFMAALSAPYAKVISTREIIENLS